MLLNLYRWLTLQDYDMAKAEVRKGAVRRFSRGNISIQRGKYIDDGAMKRLRARAAVARRQIERDLARHA